MADKRAAAGFDPLTLPLGGRRLIEASAGTGKTWNIANLYLRLLLGHGLERALAVERILVVTFTRAATAELHGRIRERVEEALELFSADAVPAHTDPFLAALRDGMEEARRRQAARDLRVALESLDDAAIHTIDGFAVRCLQSFLFESGALADVEVDETSGLRDEAILRDAYRRFIGDGCAERDAFLEQADLASLDRFLSLGRQAGRSDAELRLPGDEVPCDLDAVFRADRDHARRLAATHRSLAAEWERLKAETGDAPKQWQERINAELGGSGVRFDRGYYVKWLDAQLGRDGASYEDRRARPPAYFEQWLALGAGDGEGELFGLVLRFRDQYLAAMERADRLGSRARAGLIAQFRRERALAALDPLGLDDVKRLLNERLADGAAGARLRRALTGRYPVCLVDEFQDTDPAQFALFNRLYGDGASGDEPAGGSTGLFMIGDPKQSIYGFRGADIFSYLRVRATVRDRQAPGDPAIVTLDTNWRSTRELVQVANELFAEPAGSGDTTFLYEGINHEPVAASEDRPGVPARDRLRVAAGSGLSDAPVVFVGRPGGGDEAMTFSALRRDYARDTARRIAALLDRRHPARLDNGDQSRALRARDIAVLVSNRTEAGAIRQALGGLGIDSVFLSQRDSVFQTAEHAADLLQLLRAIHDPGNPALLRAALATPLLRGFRPDFEELDRLDEDEGRFEALVEEFGAYRDAWLANGVLSALNRLARDRQLLERIARLPDSERVATDLRHLGDLLQERDLETASPEEVIDWYARQLEDDEAVDEDRKRIRLESDEGLVRIVTIHVSKGLQYPIVFLPFFYMHGAPRGQQLPLFHDPKAGFETVIDFAEDPDRVAALRDREALAERLRLLYVAMTRAESQCVVGISAATHSRKPCWPRTAWAHLLGLDTEMPSWEELRAAIGRRLPSAPFAFAEVGDCAGGDVAAEHPGGEEVELVFEDRRAPESWWLVTSFSRLARGGEETGRPGTGWGEKGDDDRERAPAEGEPAGPAPPSSESELLPAERSASLSVPPRETDPEDEAWRQDIRYRLRGSARTGSCLHDVLERQLRAPSADLEQLVEELFSQYGLDAPPPRRGPPEEERAERRRRWLAEASEWLGAALRQPLSGAAGPALPSLAELFRGGQAVPELLFDFSIGAEDRPLEAERVERALGLAGLAPLRLPAPRLHGLMTGAVDLTFVHDGKVYIADYKSNTLGLAPRFYGPGGMDEAMRTARYDLQYLIYATAVHRHFRERLSGAYAYDAAAGQIGFGGVLYLFLRGMGLDDPRYASHGVWFHRPSREAVETLDLALRGRDGDSPA